MTAKLKRIRPASFYLAVLLALTLAILLCDLVLNDDVAVIFQEGHSIEVTSALLLFSGVFLWFWLGAATHDRRNWHIPLILLLMALREKDFDVRFTSAKLLQFRLYTGDSSLWEKAIGAMVIGLILWCAVRLAVINLPNWLRGLMRLSSVSWLVGSAGLLLVIAKSLDGIERKLADFNVALPRDSVVLAGRVEELLEMVMALMLAQAVTIFSTSLNQLPSGLGTTSGSRHCSANSALAWGQTGGTAPSELLPRQ